MFAVFTENESVLKKYLRRFASSSHDIEDICQETVLRALEAEKAREIKEPRAFLFGIAKNVVRKELDKKSRGLLDFIADFTPDEYSSNEPTIEAQLDSHARMLRFGEALMVLPSQCQRVFVLKKVQGYSHKEIAQKLRISVSTVEKHVATGLKRTKEYMQLHQNEKGPGDAGKTENRRIVSKF